MKYAIAVLICLTFSAAVFADAKIVQTINSSGIMGQPPKNDTMTIYVKGPKARIDMGGASGLYQIIDVTAKKAFIVDPQKKTVMVMTSEQMKKTAGMLSQLAGTKQTPPTIKKLGTSKTYNGYKCDEYNISMASPIQTNGTYCISSEIDLRKDLEGLTSFSQEFARMF